MPTGAQPRNRGASIALAASVLLLAGAGAGSFLLLADSEVPEEERDKLATVAPADVPAAAPVTGPPLKPTEVALFGAEVIEQSHWGREVHVLPRTAGKKTGTDRGPRI